MDLLLRFCAFCADVFIIKLLLILAFFGISKPFSQYYDLISEPNVEFEIKFFSIRIFVFILYCSLLEASKLQGTLGKKIFGIKVVDDQKHRISFAKSLIRNF